VYNYLTWFLIFAEIFVPIYSKNVM